jgi:hypothetical protein
MGENSCGEEGWVGVAMRWTTDPGAIPGEPYDYLDTPVGKNGEIGEAKAVIVEVELPGVLVGKLECSAGSLSARLKPQDRRGMLLRPMLTPRFTEAVDYARQMHVAFRKGTQVPYMAHLLGVASLVLGETGNVRPITVTEDMVIAAKRQPLPRIAPNPIRNTWPGRPRA